MFSYMPQFDLSDGLADHVSGALLALGSLKHHRPPAREQAQSALRDTTACAPGYLTAPTSVLQQCDPSRSAETRSIRSRGAFSALNCLAPSPRRQSASGKHMETVRMARDPVGGCFQSVGLRAARAPRPPQPIHCGRSFAIGGDLADEFAKILGLSEISVDRGEADIGDLV